VALDPAEVRRIARLAKLELDTATIESLAQDLDSILRHVETLGSDPELQGEGPPSSAGPGPTPLRDDVPSPSLPAASALANAPDSGAGHFRVPRVLGE
jgi:aspartyl-tRNA(Asn)/glutamyl-tRNA(Gln) amidotransferase subunit C